MTEIVTFVKENVDTFLAIWGGIITISSLIVKLTPSQEDDKILSKIINVLNVLALNPTQKKEEKE